MSSRFLTHFLPSDPPVANGGVVINHQDNVGAFAGAHTWLWIGQLFFNSRISVTTAAPANEEIEQARASFRFVSSRVFGRVN